MTTVINQKEYLKKYLSGIKKKKKKKKAATEEKFHKVGIKIVEDVTDITYGFNDDDDDDDAPMIAEVTYDDPKTKLLDDFPLNKWKQVGGETYSSPSDCMETTDDLQQKNNQLGKPVSREEYNQSCNLSNKIHPKSDQHYHKSQPKMNDKFFQRGEKHNLNKSSPVRNKYLSPDSFVQRKGNRHDSISPLRTKQHDSNNSPRRKGHDLDNSPSKKKRNESDNSQPRKKWHDSDNSQPRRKRHDSHNSPPRRKRHDGDSSPLRKSHESGYSPPRKRHDSDNSPLRQRHISDNSPPRRKRHDSDNSSPSKKRHDSDNSPQRRKRHDLDNSPPRRKGHDSDNSPQRRKRHDSDNSPPRKSSNSGLVELLEPNIDSAIKKQNSRKKMTTAEFLKARKLGKLKEETEEDFLKKEKTAALQKAVDEKYKTWNKGVFQEREKKKRAEDYFHEVGKSFARTVHDSDMNDYLKQTMREEDPMREYIMKKKQKSDNSAHSFPIYQGSFPPNRFNIRPGYRWDGVDRSTGYEQDWFNRQNSQRASQEDMYKWSMEDM